MVDKKKLIILTLDAGFGHRRAATAIQNAIKEIHGDAVDSKIVNPVKEEGLSSIVQKLQVRYDNTIRDHREFYSTAFGILNHYPISIIADHAVTQLLVKEVTETILSECPDGIISTFPFFSTSIRHILFLLQLHIPFYSIVTDLDNVHRIWFHPGPDKYFVASEQLKFQAVECNVKPSKVIISGIPVDTRISTETRDKATLRKQLGWDLSLPTILAISSKRVQNLLDKLIAIEGSDIPLQLCIIAGGDDSFYKSVTCREWKVPVHCYNFVENMPEFLLATDILITKAGGLITSEGLACGLPIILVDVIEGQESGNVDYLLNNSAGVLLDSNHELQQTIKKWLLDDHRLMNKFADNAKRIGKPEAAYVIGNAMVSDMYTNKYQSKNKGVWSRVQLITNPVNISEDS